MGDEQILPDLKAFVLTEPSDAERLRIVSNAIWEIKIQHPPSQMITFLTEGRHDASSIGIVRRAVELGMPRDELRDAVLAYYDKCPQDKLRFFRLAGLDEAVLELGLLSIEELPDRDVIEAKQYIDRLLGVE